MNKKRGKGAIIGFIIAAIVAVGVTIFTLFFNGRYLYFTFGMSDKDIIKTDTIHLPEAAARILLSDEKQSFTDISESTLSDESLGGETIQNELKNNVKSKLSRIVALNRMAVDKNISLTPEQQDRIKQIAQEYESGLSEPGKEFLGLTKESLEEFITKYTIADVMRDKLMSDSQIEISTDEARVILIQYICSDNEESVSQARTRIEAGEPFYEVAAGVNEDSDFDAELTRGMTKKEFEDAAFALKTGEISDVISSDGKYYIIKCSSDNEQTKTDSNREALLQKAQYNYFEKKIVPFENSLYFEFNNNAWNKIRFDNIPEAGVKFYDIYTKYMEE